MKPTDFARLLSAFLTTHLGGQRNASPNTVRSYRDTFVLLLRHLGESQRCAVEKITLASMDAPVIVAFLEHLQKDRGCCARTCNQRLAALHAFARYVQVEEPEQMVAMQRVLAIPSRRFEHKPIAYLEAPDLEAVLAQPDATSSAGRRDAALLSLLYDTGARRQEVLDLTVKDIRLDTPAHVSLTGKGRKTRVVPLMASTVALIRGHLQEHGLEGPDDADRPVFAGRHDRALTPSGLRYLLAKHARTAARDRTGLPAKIGPHTLRHTKAMHMLQAGIPLVVIRDILGHVDLKTTSVYSRADLEMKRRALETTATAPTSPTARAPLTWRDDKSLMAWLTAL